MEIFQGVMKAFKENEVLKRILTALIAIPPLLLILWKGGIYLKLLIIFLTFIGLREFSEISGKSGDKIPFLPLFVITSTAIVLGSYDAQFFLLLLFAGWISIFFISLLYGGPRFSLAAVSLFAFIYFFLPMTHAIMMRENEGGVKYLIYTLAGTFLSDTGGYFVGKAFGYHKVAPAISPGKSWEGVFGGIIVCFFGLLFCSFIFTGRLNWEKCLFLSILLTFFGLLGDLLESSMKRTAGVKDSGNFFPGHGGVLDRLDSLLVNIPLAFYYFKYVRGF